MAKQKQRNAARGNPRNAPKRSNHGEKAGFFAPTIEKLLLLLILAGIFMFFFESPLIKMQCFSQDLTKPEGIYDTQTNCPKTMGAPLPLFMGPTTSDIKGPEIGFVPMLLYFVIDVAFWYLIACALIYAKNKRIK
ncbi:MAG: hypothetical protein AABX01_03530 [Candidatus Micrarchaeota archaeon]